MLVAFHPKDKKARHYPKPRVGRANVKALRKTFIPYYTTMYMHNMYVSVSTVDDVISRGKK